MIGLKHRPRPQAATWLTLWCFTLFSLLPGHLLPAARAGASSPTVICTQDGLVEVDLGTDSLPDQERSHDCGHCVLGFCPAPVGSSCAIVDDDFHPQTADAPSLSAMTSVGGHCRSGHWSPAAPRAPPLDLPS